MTEVAHLAREQTAGEIETVAAFGDQMPTGVTVSHGGRVFVNFPRWGDRVDYTVAEVVHATPVPYPDVDLNVYDPDRRQDCLVSVQSVVVDPRDRLWILDTGSIEMEHTAPGGPKLVGVDLRTDTVFRKITFPSEVAAPTTYLNDIRFDLRRGEGGLGFITDSTIGTGPSGIIVVELTTARSWRRLHDHPSVRPEPDFTPIVEGWALAQLPMGADGIAIDAGGERLFYSPLASRRLYSVSVDALADPAATEEEVARTVDDHGEKGASDGLESDAEGRVYATNYEHNAVLRRAPDGRFETLVHDPRALWPDTLSVARGGYLYFTANQLHRQAQFHGGQDLRRPPYPLFRVSVDAEPVLLGE